MPRRDLELANPHSVMAALERRPDDVIEIHLPPRGAGEAWALVAAAARDRGVPVRQRPGQADSSEHRSGNSGRSSRGDRSGHPGRPARGDRTDRTGKPGKPHHKPHKSGAADHSARSGAARAIIRPADGLDPEDLFADARATPRGVWLALDRLQDPRNVGAIFRSAAFFGVQGVLLTREQSAPLSAVAYDAASGGLEHVPFAWVTNLSRELGTARDAGVWVLGAAEEASHDVRQIPRDRPWLLVVGSEEKGLRRLTRENCDDLCRLTPRGAVGTLNVSVAAAVLVADLVGAPEDDATGDAGAADGAATGQSTP